MIIDRYERIEHGTRKEKGKGEGNKEQKNHKERSYGRNEIYTNNQPM